jgi:4-diphosphocytidyl-2-C-methyl-D-erythritol kinase
MDANGLELKEKNYGPPSPRPWRVGIPARISVYQRALVVKSLGVVNPLPTVTVFSPAKINLYLAVTGRRADGYHDLVSVVAPLEFGDTLYAEAGGDRHEAGGDSSLECDDPEVPRDEANLVLKATRLFREATGWKAAVAFRLTKRIPLGAGLGGGSSNAAAALLALNQLSGAGLDRTTLTALAAQVGSDCPLFLPGGPVVMRGRGEQVAPLPAAAAGRWRGRCVLLFKPNFSIRTAWAYERLAVGAPAGYLPAAEAEHRLAAWVAGEAGAGELLFNSLEPVVFQKFIALPALLERLRTRFGLVPHMSGSGSACFALLPDGAPVEEITGSIREAWGPRCFVQLTAIA